MTAKTLSPIRWGRRFALQAAIRSLRLAIAQGDAVGVNVEPLASAACELHARMVAEFGPPLRPLVAIADDLATDGPTGYAIAIEHARDAMAFVRRAFRLSRESPEPWLASIHGFCRAFS